MYNFTHVILGICISLLLMLEMPYVIIGSIMPDIDFLLPVAHRGATHSLLVGLVAFAFVYYKIGYRRAISLFIGFFSHLALDALTPMGIYLLFPLPIRFSFDIAASGDALANMVVIMISAVLILNRHMIRDYLSSLEPRRIRRFVYIFICCFLLVLVLFGNKGLFGCSGTEVSMDNLISMQQQYDGVEIITQGTICSGVSGYTSSGGNMYQIFDLCSGNATVKVWKLLEVQDSNIYENDKVNICGTFTLAYSEPEINYIEYVVKI